MFKLLNYLLILIIPIFPKFFIKFFAYQYVAGITIKEAIDTVRKINNKGLSVTLDILGEHTRNNNEAIHITNQYCKILDEIKLNSLNCNISIKLSHIGTDISYDLFMENLNKIQSCAINTNNFVRIDMENSTLTDMILNAYNKRVKINKNIGIVLQSYLFRTQNDLNNLEENSNIRICKGIYNESDEISFKKTSDINNNFIKLLKLAFKKNIYTGIATHDSNLIDEALEIIEKMNIYRSMFEFQMLHGVPMENYIKTILNKNYRIRIYVPFGPDWYNYSIRRIKENPNLSKYIVKNIFKK